MRYFVLHVGRDSMRAEFMIKEELERKLNENYWEDAEIVREANVSNLMDGSERLYILKGELVQPSEVKSVTEWQLP